MKKSLIVFNLAISISCLPMTQEPSIKPKNDEPIASQTTQTDTQAASGNEDADYVLLTQGKPKSDRKPPRLPKKPKVSDFQPHVASDLSPKIIENYRCQQQLTHVAALALSAHSIHSASTTSSESNNGQQLETPRSALSPQSSDSPLSQHSSLAQQSPRPQNFTALPLNRPAQFASSDKDSVTHSNDVIVDIQHPDLPSGVKQDQLTKSSSHAARPDGQEPSQPSAPKLVDSNKQESDSKKTTQNDGKKKRWKFSLECFKSSKCCNLKALHTKSSNACCTNCCFPWCSKKKNKNG
jgi:hypothetical protein